MGTHTHTRTQAQRAGAPSSYQRGLPPPSPSLPLRRGGKEGEKGRASEGEREREIPSSLLSPGSPSCSLDCAVTRAACLLAHRNGGVWIWRWSVLRQSGHRSEGLGGDEKATGRDHVCAQAAARFHAKVAEETGNSSVFTKRETRGRGGMGVLGAPRKPYEFAFIRCVMTRNVSPMVVPTCCWREVEGRGSTSEATPANTEDGFIFRYYNRHGGRGYIPNARNTTHMARPLGPPLPPPPHWQGGVGRSAPFSKAFFAYEIYFAAGGLQPSCRLMLHYHLPKKNTDRRGRKREFWMKLQRVIYPSL